LPAVGSGNKGFRVTVRNVGTLTFRVTPNASDGIDDRAAGVQDSLNAKYSSVTYRSTGTSGAGAGKGWAVEHAEDYLVGTPASPPAFLGVTTVTAVATVTLTAGEWDLAGELLFTVGNATGYTTCIGGMNAGSAALGPLGDGRLDAIAPTANYNQSITFSAVRYICTGTTIVYYLSGYSVCNAGATTNGAYGRLSARRVR